MRTEVISLTRVDDLEKSIDLKKFYGEKSLLIQIFSGLGGSSLKSLSKTISEELPEATVIGATTDGEINNQRVSAYSITVSFTVFETVQLKAHLITECSDSFTAGVLLSNQIIDWETKLLILFTDGLNTNGEAFLNGVESVNHFIPVSGGMAGDNAKFKSTWITLNGQTVEKGAVGVSLSSKKLRVYTEYNFDWKPIGRQLKITRADNNRVYTIDDVEAGQVYKKYLGDEVYQRLPATGIEFPLILVDRSLPVARAVLSINREDNSLTFAGNLKEGESVQFGVGNVSMIIQDAMSRGRKFRELEIDSFFVYSCMARRRLMPDNIYMETEFFSKIAQTVGFFTYGEFFNSGKKSELLNQTMTIVALSEKELSPLPEERSLLPETLSASSDEFLNMKALSHLIDVSTKELLTYQKSIKDSLLYLDTVLNNISDFIITTNGKYLVKANSSFYNFFKFKGEDDFHKVYNCVCDTFEEERERGYIGKYINGVLWTDYIYYNKDETHKAKIRSKIFQIKVEKTDINGEKTYIVILNSITEFENKEQKLQEDLTEKLDFIDHLVDTLPIPFFYKDENFVYRRVNREYLELLGVTDTDVVGRSVYEIYEPELAEIYTETDQELMSRDVNIFETELLNRRGETLNVIFYKSSVLKKDGSFNGIMGVILDITDRKSTEEQLLSFKSKITESIDYASNIQQSIVPSTERVKSFFKDLFICWHPRDKVGGDIYLFHEFDCGDKALLMVIDCTGHGVYGAFITMLVKAIERQIISQISSNYMGPAEILKFFNQKMREMTKRKGMRSYLDIGFDGGVLYIDRKERIIRYSGANIPLFLYDSSGISEVKGSRCSVGYQGSQDIDPKEIEIKYGEEGVKGYITTDGYIDQTGGKKGFSYGKRRFKALLERVQHKRFYIQEKEFRVEMERYRGGEATIDDITIIGFKL